MIYISIYHYYIKFPTPIGEGIVRDDEVEARSYNVDLPRFCVKNFQESQLDRLEEGWLRKPFLAVLTKIGITKKHCKRSEEDRLSFNKIEVDPYPYPGISVIAIPIAGASLPKVLVNKGSYLNILYVKTLKRMGIPMHFLQ